MTTVERILRLQRPFPSRRSARRYRRYLDLLPSKKSAALLDDLKKQAALPPTAPQRGWRPSSYHGSRHA